MPPDKAVSNSKYLYLSPPHISDEGYELQLVEECFRTNYIAFAGPQAKAFEEELASYVGIKYAAALCSGTAGLHLALRILGVSTGDIVLCSTFTFASSANVIVYQNAEPVFIDSDLKSWNMDPNLLEDELKRCDHAGRLPKAVIVVDLYGQSADYNAILDISGRFGVPVVEDAAEALGATYKGKKCGVFGEMGVFSFNGNKIITTSGGGMLVSAKENYIKTAAFLASQARDPAPHYEHSQIGYNYRLSAICAAIGRGQLRVLDKRLQQRRQVFITYYELMKNVPGISFIPKAEYGRSNCWLTAILVEPKEFGASREEIYEHLEKQGIQSRPLWKPMHLQPVFRHCRSVGGKVSETLFEKGLCIPSGSALTKSDIERVVENILALRKY